jgi:hypothetical protein
MSNPTVILLGGTAFCRGVVDVFHRLGLRVVTVDRNAAVEVPCELHIRSDLLDVPCIMAKLKENGVGNIRGAYAAADIGVRTANQINAAFAGRSVPEETLSHITAKDAMTRKWAAAGLLNRESKTCVAFDDSIAAFSRGRKTLVKPNDSSSSRGITILGAGATPDELRAAFETARKMGTDGKVLVEEFVEGTELTVEMLGDGYGNVSVYGISVKHHTENTINNKIAVKLHYNSLTLSDEDYQRIASFGADCYRAFGLRNSFGHLEVLRKQNGGLVPVEINSRSAGFVAHPLVDATSGRTYVADYLDVLAGGRVTDGLLKTGTASAYYFYDLPAGIPARVETHLMKHLDPRIASPYHDRSRLKAGRRYELLTCDNDRHGFETLIGDRTLLTAEAILRAERAFLGEFFGAQGDA